ncbi:MAG: hypothetical protein H7145_14980 [Akkermansiaceae bacterium]|nr:hypothetical protein [Armatimonadota bacterium]
MYVSRGRQHYIYNRGQVLSASVFAALLSALLLLSPGTARAVAHVLAENGVPLPANVARVLDALPADPARDTLRRDDETACATASESEATPENEPKPAATDWSVPATPSALFAVIAFPPPFPGRGKYVGVATRHAAYSRVSPRAPPV